MWKQFTTKEIKLQGWLKRQLEIQADGLNGNLDKVWRDVRDSAWIGGEAESWERVPYWLDGFIPLAYLLENEDMIMRAKKYINAIIENQQPDGWICPCTEEKRPTYDSWAVQLILKVLTVYYECSGDARVPDVIYKAVKNYYTLLSNGTIKLYNWGKARWFESFITLNFLYERYEENWIKDLAKILKNQGTNYPDFMEKWERPLNKWTFETHIVNLAMCLKYEAVSKKLLGEAYVDMAEVLYQQLYKFNGTPVGVFTGDECLSGLSPIQGTELCSVVELMYSFEQLFKYTGDRKWAERLEVVAFNALPATISDDMWTHQYDQLSNQIACIKFPNKPIFRTNSGDAHLFGLEPCYGCCTANFGQGWPKFVLSSFMYNENEIINVVPVPANLNCQKAEILVKTDYPFKNEITYAISAKEDFDFIISVPSWAKNFSEKEIRYTVRKGEKREISISYDSVPEYIDRPYNLKCVKAGPLVFSLPVQFEKKMYEYEQNSIERKFPYCDYEYIPTSKWNYAFTDTTFTTKYNGIKDVPFSSENPPINVSAKVKSISWGYEDGFDTLCAKIPESRETFGEEQEVVLYPYGCAKLRMTEMPLVLFESERR